MHPLSKLAAWGWCVAAAVGVSAACGQADSDARGTSGRGGSSGRGGAAGAAGSSGTSGGSGGADHACIPLAVEDSLSHCPRLSGQPTSECPLEATCVALRCGQTGSQFDETGCRRAECTSSSDCSSEERCVAPPLQGIFNLCYSSAYASVEHTCDACVVTASADCATPAFCMLAREAPPAEDCAISGLSCSALLLAQAAVMGYLEQWDEEDDELLGALTACHDRIRDARAACYPPASGGAGGESGHGGEAGR